MQSFVGFLEVQTGCFLLDACVMTVHKVLVFVLCTIFYLCKETLRPLTPVTNCLFS